MAASRAARWKRIRACLRAANAARELHTAGVPERDLADLDADRVLPDDPKKADGFLLRKDVHAETLLLTGGAAAFREGAREIFAVTKYGPPRAATSLYIPGACNYHVCRPLYDWGLDPLHMSEWEQLHVEFCPLWTR